MLLEISRYSDFLSVTNDPPLFLGSWFSIFIGMRITARISNHCMMLLERITYNSDLKIKNCGKTALKDRTMYTAIDHINNVNAFHRTIEEWCTYYRGVASIYINRYAALFVLVIEYAGCGVHEILINVKRRLRKLSDFFSMTEMMIMG